MKEIVIYLKTTETCNLNCLHCFTSGSRGAKIFWNHTAVADWVHRLSLATTSKHVHLEFHGGEPFLADLSSLQYVYDHCQNLWPSQSWGATSNLTFKLTDEIIQFIQGPLGNRIATSWDPDIRFANDKQYQLWRKNVELLLSIGVDVKLFVSVTRGVVNMEPIELLKWVKDLGVKELALERLTLNGNAKKNLHIFPSNVEQDQWFLRMHQQSEKAGARDWFDNEFLESIYDKFEKNFTTSGTFCRDCEERLFTVNADGSLAGCPNSAPEDAFGHISDNVSEMLVSPKRIGNIACERSRDPRCYSCPVFDKCGSDCHQLGWEGNVCGAPKSLMLHLAGINTQTRKLIAIKEI